MSELVDGHKNSGAYLQLIASLFELDPPLCIFGGFAEDALLYGKVSRPHSDVDVLVLRDELSLRMDQFRRLGFVDFEVYYAITPGRPLVLNGEREGLHLELGLFELTPAGQPYFEVRAEDGALSRITLSDDTLKFPPSVIEGVRIRTVSPLALHQIRAGLDAIRAFGDLRPTDIPAQQLLKEKFFSERREEDLLPRIERVGG